MKGTMTMISEMTLTISRREMMMVTLETSTMGFKKQWNPQRLRQHPRQLHHQQLPLFLS